MRYFWITDSKKPKRAKPCGLLAYDERTREFAIQIGPDADVEHVPMLFIPFIERGERTIGPDWALEWVKERIVPSNRQNIGEILEAHGLDEYDEFALLVSGEGRCSQDDFMIREVQPAEGSGAPSHSDADRPRGGKSEASKRPGRRSPGRQEDSGESTFDRAFAGRSFYEYAFVSIPSPTVGMLKDMVGQQIAQARKDAGLSQDHVARASGIPRPTLSLIERGLANPTLETIAAICDGLKAAPLFRLTHDQSSGEGADPPDSQTP